MRGMVKLLTIISVKFMKISRKITIGLDSAFVLVAIILALLISTNVYITSVVKDQIYTNIDNLPKSQAVLILGAKVYPNGNLSPYLRDRADTAIAVYSAGKAHKILISGDHGQDEYDEVNAIKDYVLLQGVPDEDIFLDHAGFDTYDSLVRARFVFNVTSLIVSTQDFHLARAVYIGNAQGIEIAGMSADIQEYENISRNYHREYLARAKSFFDVLIGAEPQFLGEVYSIDGDGRSTWDI